MNIHEKSIAAIRVLSAEAIERAKSGHPGLPLGAAAIGYELFSKHLKVNPQNPDFFDRDRFVLSAGHGTMLLYSLLHLFGYEVSMDDIKNFRQLGSKTPGHPELGVTAGVDCSTGPLGQGIANAVGLAAAETMLAARFNKQGFEVVNHHTFALCGEGCLMEGIANEAASLAGTWKLSKLIVLYDCNKITIEGQSDLAFDEDIAKRHEAQGWTVLRVANGNDIWEIGKAIETAKKSIDKPVLIMISTKIGFGSPQEGCSACHGASIGEAGIKKLRENLGWNEPPFTVPDEVYSHCRSLIQGQKTETEWNELIKEYAKKYPKEYGEFAKAKEGLKKNDGIFKELYAEFKGKTIAGRKAGSIILNRLAKECAELTGGSADLGPSNLTVLEGLDYYSSQNRAGRNMHFGVREHAMAAICNGMALHGGFLPFCSTFFSFSDYMKNAVRMSALMKLPVIYIFTHDTIAVGEDGPTHQPIEHLSGLRAMPDLRVFRPCDGVETVAAFESVFKDGLPVAIVEAKQDLPAIEGTSADAATKGGYIVFEGGKKPQVILISSGSEVSLCVEAAKLLKAENIAARVVSMPCNSIFDEQSESYKNSVLPSCVRARVAVEAGSSLCWGKYVGLDGDYVCIDKFGASGKAGDLFKEFKITTEEIVKKAKGVTE